MGVEGAHNWPSSPNNFNICTIAIENLTVTWNESAPIPNYSFEKKVQPFKCSVQKLITYESSETDCNELQNVVNWNNSRVSKLIFANRHNVDDSVKITDVLSVAWQTYHDLNGIARHNEIYRLVPAGQCVNRQSCPPAVTRPWWYIMEYLFNFGAINQSPCAESAFDFSCAIYTRRMPFILHRVDTEGKQPSSANLLHKASTKNVFKHT